MLAPTLSDRDNEAAAERAEARYSDLFGELFGALVQCDPGRKVSTPGWHGGEAPAFDVLADELAGTDSDDMRSRVCYVLGSAAVQTGDAALQEMALRLLRDVAHRHADGRCGLAQRGLL